MRIVWVYCWFFFNELYSSGSAPQSFGRSIIFPLYKKGAQNVVSNYRGISFMDTLAKIYAGMLLERLTIWMTDENILNEFQAGFRKKYSTVDNIFNLISVCKFKLRVKRSKVYAFFIDFASVFDRINRHYLWYKLSNEGVSTKFIGALSSLYERTESAVRVGKSSSTPFFETRTGVKQGCLLSPALFALFMNDLHESLGEGVWVGDREVRHLSYADDVILMSSSVIGLQRMIDDLKKYCMTWDLELNLGKSKIMVFRNGGRPSSKERWFFGNQEIEVVNRFKYLGVTLTPTLTFTPHLQEKCSAAKLSIASMWRPFMSHNEIAFPEKLKVFEAVSRSILCYAAQVWGFGRSEAVESVLRFSKVLQTTFCFWRPICPPCLLIHCSCTSGTLRKF